VSSAADRPELLSPQNRRFAPLSRFQPRGPAGAAGTHRYGGPGRSSVLDLVLLEFVPPYGSQLAPNDKVDELMIDNQYFSLWPRNTAFKVQNTIIKDYCYVVKHRNILLSDKILP